MVCLRNICINTLHKGDDDDDDDDNNNIFVKEQFGFRSKISTEAVFYSLILEILNALNNENIIGGIFCDLTKAFDSINHGILL